MIKYRISPENIHSVLKKSNKSPNLHQLGIELKINYYLLNFDKK